MKSKILLSSIVITLCSIFMLMGGVNAEDALTITTDRVVEYPGDYAYLHAKEGDTEVDVNWTLSGNSSSDTELRNTQYGEYLNVSSNESSTKLIITAIKTDDDTKIGTLEINLTMPTRISTINFTYDEGAIPFSSSISLKDMSTWVQENVGSDTENISVYNDSNSNLVYKLKNYNNENYNNNNYNKEK